MDITVNGRAEQAAEGETVFGLLARLGLDPAKVVVERNRAIVPGDAFAGTELQDGDALEILRFVGGG